MSPAERYAKALQLAAEYRRGAVDGSAPPLAAFLAEHSDVRRQLEAMLTASGEPSFERAAVTETLPQAPRSIGPYRVLGPLGSGGMGDVHLAERVDLEQRVAIKVIRRGILSRAVVDRFELERKALAKMNHDAIARVFDSGTTDAGDPYFVMELVEDGTPITRYCDALALGLTERIRLFQQVCDGVQHAHLKGLMHRDLKPGNVLVTSQGPHHRVKLIDFGIAVPIEAVAAFGGAEAWRAGTPEYMSPEQASGDSQQVDSRTDVYSLGVLLYELLTGCLPFGSDELRHLPTQALQQRLREVEPPRPSTRVTTAQGTRDVSATCGMPPERLARTLRRDLDWIVLRAMAKDADDRYATPSELSQDLDRYLAGAPVAAVRGGMWYRWRKFGLRHRRAVLAAALSMVAVLLALSSSVETYAREREIAQLVVAFQLQDMMGWESAMHPPWPEQVAHMERWLDELRRLAALRPNIQQTLDTLRSHAIREVDQQDADAGSATQRLPRLRARLAALEYAHSIRTNQRELIVPELSASELALHAMELSDRAWPYVVFHAAMREWGDEPHALALAQRAVETSGDLTPLERASVADTLAWAWFANGRDKDALAASELAATLAPPERRDFEATVGTMRAMIQCAAGSAGQRELIDARLAVSLAEREARAHVAYRFEPGCETDQVRHDELTEVLERIDLLEQVARPAVERRLTWARRIESVSRDHPNARVTWAAARAAIAKADDVVASSRYRGQNIELADADVIGLVPIGMNPVTRLWEFYELRSAWDGVCDPASIPIPRHIATGEHAGGIELREDLGIVFVLLPGGTCTLGSQRSDPSAPNFDEFCKPEERTTVVALPPFFVARHELTKGQWKRLSDREPPGFFQLRRGYDHAPEAIGYSHPIESVDWFECAELLGRFGMALPTGDQWEYACRGGTSTPWWCGGEAATLFGVANVLDITGQKRNANWGQQEGDFDDGRVPLGPVGSYRANDFGLFDTHGNVREWTTDEPQVPPGAPSLREFRGGCFDQAASAARSSHRFGMVPHARSSTLGVRAVRRLTR